VTGYRIGDLARYAGTKVETIRWYEKVGLLPRPARTEGNYRVYGEAERRRLGFIRRARDLGFPLDQIRAFIELADDRSGDCCRIDAMAGSHLRDVERRIADLEALRRELSALIASCAGGTVAECGILDSLSPEESAGGTPAAPKRA
jgi:DNA-binding transcriptional MerR regulator